MRMDTEVTWTDNHLSETDRGSIVYRIYTTKK